MYYDYLDLAERLNTTLPNDDGRSAKIYTWQNRYDTKKHGVTANVIMCNPEEVNKLKWEETDIAVDISKRNMKEAVIKAYRFICDKLSIKFVPMQIRLSN
jgi:hypothetical protein